MEDRFGGGDILDGDVRVLVVGADRRRGERVDVDGVTHTGDSALVGGRRDGRLAEDEGLLVRLLDSGVPEFRNKGCDRHSVS